MKFFIFALFVVVAVYLEVANASRVYKPMTRSYYPMRCPPGQEPDAENNCREVIRQKPGEFPPIDPSTGRCIMPGCWRRNRQDAPDYGTGQQPWRQCHEVTSTDVQNRCIIGWDCWHPQTNFCPPGELPDAFGVCREVWRQGDQNCPSGRCHLSPQEAALPTEPEATTMAPQRRLVAPRRRMP